MNVKSVNGVRVITLLKPEQIAVANVLNLLEDLAKYDKTDHSRMAAENLTAVGVRINGDGLFNPNAVKAEAGK